MAVFTYKARDKQGKAVLGEMESQNQKTLVNHLKELGYTPISIKEQKKPTKLKTLLQKFRKVSPDELNTFSRSLVTLQKAGIPILTSLDALKEQSQSKYFKEVIQNVMTDVEGGANFSDALEKHPNVFNEIYTNMIRAGEAGGVLDEVLGRLADLGEYEQELRTKIKGAMRYPMIVVLTICLAFPILITFVIPKFADLFATFEAQLPMPTRIMIWINYAIRNYWYLILLGISFLVFAFRKFIRTKKGRWIWDSFKLKIFVFGPLNLKIAMSRFSRITGTLMRSGVPILQTLGIASKTIGNVVISSVIENIIENVNQGKGMSDPMTASGIFPALMIQMVKVGEDTGRIDELLDIVSEHFDFQVDQTVRNLSTLIEPILLAIIAVFVLIMALAIFLPMWNLIKVFKGG